MRYDPSKYFDILRLGKIFEKIDLRKRPFSGSRLSPQEEFIIRNGLILFNDRDFSNQVWNALH